MLCVCVCVCVCMCVCVCVCVCVRANVMEAVLHSDQRHRYGLPWSHSDEENLLTAECDILVPAAGERSPQTLPGI